MTSMIAVTIVSLLYLVPLLIAVARGVRNQGSPALVRARPSSTRDPRP